MTVLRLMSTALLSSTSGIGLSMFWTTLLNHPIIYWFILHKIIFSIFFVKIVHWNGLKLSRCFQYESFMIYQIARFLGPTWDPSGSYGPHVGPMNLAIRVGLLLVFALWNILRSLIAASPKWILQALTDFRYWRGCALLMPCGYLVLGPDSIKRCHLTSIGNPIVGIRRP